MPRLIAFDLDGTLVDSGLDLAESANELLGYYGAAPLPVDRVVGMVGGGARLLVSRALLAGGVDAPIGDALARFLEIYDRRLVNNTVAYPGIADAICDLGGRAELAVLTNKPEDLSRKLLDALGLLTPFRWLLGGDGQFPRKPDPAGLRFLMNEARSGPAETLLVGDSVVDAETARSARAHFCICRYGFGPFPEVGRGEAEMLEARVSGEVARACARFLGEEPSGA